MGGGVQSLLLDGFLFRSWVCNDQTQFSGKTERCLAIKGKREEWMGEETNQTFYIVRDQEQPEIKNNPKTAVSNKE